MESTGDELGYFRERAAAARAKAEAAAEFPEPARSLGPMSETGSVGQRPEPKPDLPASEAAVVALMRQDLAAPDRQRLPPRTSECAREAIVPRQQFTGVSLPPTRRKPTEHRSTPPVAARTRAHSRLGTCTSLTRTQAGQFERMRGP